MAGKELIPKSISFGLDKHIVQQILSSPDCKEAVGHYHTLRKEIKWMKENIPGLLINLKDAKDKVDKVHTGVNATYIASGATSAVAGALLLGGIIAAPFTFGASIGLSIAGGVIAAGSSVASVSATITDYNYGIYSQEKTDGMVNDFINHYEKAQVAYYNLLRLCNNLKSLTSPENTEKEKEFAGKTLEIGCFIIEHASLVSTPGKKILTCGKSIHMAINNPRALHAELDVTRLRYIKDLVAPQQSLFTKNGLKAAGSQILKLSGPVMTAVGGIFTIIGIGWDIYTVCRSSYDIYKGKKTEVSERISSYIQLLEIKHQQLLKINKQIEYFDEKLAIL